MDQAPWHISPLADTILTHHDHFRWDEQAA